MDTLQQIDENIIEKLDLNKARMTLVDKERSNFLLENMPNPIYAAGGSAANTAYWISVLGGQAGFIGKVSNSMEELKDQLSGAVKNQMENGKTTFLEVMLNQELGEPFRRDAMKAPVEVSGISEDDMNSLIASG